MLKIIIPLTIVSFLLIGCGSNSKSKKTIDILDYLPNESITKNYLYTTTDKNGEQKQSTYVEEVEVDGENIFIKIDNNLSRSFEVHDESITEKEYGMTPKTLILKRFIAKGSELYTFEKTTHNKKITVNDVIIGTRTTELKKVCTFENQLDKLDSYYIPYKDDILKFECLTKENIQTKINEEWEGKLNEYKSGSVDSNYDLSTFYLKKGIGFIVEIDNNCYVQEDEVRQINDKAKKCNQESSTHSFFLNN